MQFPIYIELHRSRLLFVFLLFFHVLAIGCVLVPPWWWGIRSMLVLLICISAWYATRPPEILGLRLSEGGVLECVVANGDRFSAQVKPDSTVFNRLIVLRLLVGD